MYTHTLFVQNRKKEGEYQILRLKRSLVNMSGSVESVTKVVTGCLRMTKVTIFVAWDKKSFN